MKSSLGGGQRIRCEHVGDLTIVVRTFNPASLSRITLHDVRVVPGFGSNLLSTPRMEKAGWYLSHKVAVSSKHQMVKAVLFLPSLQTSRDCTT